jgi:Protein of unknown function (DUF3225)
MSAGTTAYASVRAVDGVDPLVRERVGREVTAEFVRYEEALVANDVETMTELFWDSPDVLRFGLADDQLGARELRAWRESQPSLPPGRRLVDTRILVLGEQSAVVTTRFGYSGRPDFGRQTQIWFRCGTKWRIVGAHVSESGVA